MKSENARDWVAKSAYCKALGITFESVSDQKAILVLPFRKENTNQTGVLHGGIAASLGVSTSMAMALHALAPESGPFHTANYSISYLTAAVGVDLVSRAHMLRKGRDLAFIGVDLEAPDGTKIAVAQSVVRGRKDQPKPALATAGDPPTATVTPPHQSRIRENAFMAGCGMDIVLQENGIAIMTMPALPQNAAGGRMHEGAMLGLMDSCGAMACWGLTGLGHFRASTPAIQASIVGPVPLTDVLATAKIMQQDGEIYWVDVTTADIKTRAVHARATVLYRMVT